MENSNRNVTCQRGQVPFSFYPQLCPRQRASFVHTCGHGASSSSPIHTFYKKLPSRHPLGLRVCTLASLSILNRSSHEEAKKALEAGLGLWGREIQYPECLEGVSEGRANLGTGSRWMRCLTLWTPRPAGREGLLSSSKGTSVPLRYRGRRLDCSVSVFSIV